MLDTVKRLKIELQAAHQQDDTLDGELTALITEIALAPALERFGVFSECALEASVWVHQGRLAKRDMVDRFVRVAEAYGLITDCGVDGIQNVLANTLKEAAAIGETALSNGDDNNKLDEIALRQDATLSALPALPAPHIQPDQSITGTWAEPDWTILDDRRGELPEFPTDTFSAPWQDWLKRAARGAGATEGHVAVPLLAIASSLIGTARRVRASSSWSESCTMWTGVVGCSGTAKTPGIDVTKRALVKIEKDRKPKIAELKRQHESQIEIAKAEYKKWSETSEFEEFRQQVHSEKAGLVGRESEWWAKAQSHVLRVAGTLSYLGWAIDGGREPKLIESDIVKAAIRLVRDYFWPHSRAALRQIGISQRHADARCVLLWARAHNRKEISVLDARREALGQRLDAKKTHALLDSLVSAGWLRKMTAPTGGRPLIRWEVNPTLFTGAESAGSAER